MLSSVCSVTDIQLIEYKIAVKVQAVKFVQVQI